MCQIKYNTNKKEKKYSHINYTERTQIERWWNVEHKSKVEIANLLNKSERTIRREIKKGLIENLTHDWKTIYVYSADIAQNKYEYNKTGKGPQLKLGNDYELKEYIEKGIKKDKKSPEILLAQIEEYDLKFKSKVCAKTIRNCIHKGGIFELTDKDMIYNKEYKEKNKEKAHCSRVPAEKSIDFRPQEANDRSVYGHWEGDLVIGQKERGAVLFTLTERKKREEIIMKLPNKEAKNVSKALDTLEKRYGKEFSNKFKTITFDNGPEFQSWESLEKSYDKRKKAPRVAVYYAHPYRSGERGSNENNNRLIRRFIPKGTNITKISDEYIQWVEDWINNLLRPMFGYKSALQI